MKLFMKSFLNDSTARLKIHLKTITVQKPDKSIVAVNVFIAPDEIF